MPLRLYPLLILFIHVFFKYGLEVFTVHIEDFQPKQEFDVITMRHILEHIENSLTVLDKLRSILSDYGVLLVTLPNINFIGRYVFQELWEWILPWHLHFYQPQTILRLLERSGFESLRIYQTPSPFWYP